MKKIKVTFLDGTIVEGETDSLPRAESHSFYMRVEGQRTIIGMAGIRYIDILHDE